MQRWRNITSEELYNYDKLMNDYYSKLFSCGLDLSDYEDINKIWSEFMRYRRMALYDYSEYVRLHGYILNGNMSDSIKEKTRATIDSKKEYFDELDKLAGESFKLRELLRKSIVPRTLKGTLIDECSTVHLVYTNKENGGEIVPRGNGGFISLCQFHIEKNPSMSINNVTGSIFCYGCGISLNLVTYFMELEKITYQEAVNLLAKIYMIRMKNEIYSDTHPLVIKYRKSILDKEYRSLLMGAYEKVSKRESTWMNEVSSLKLKHDMDTIDRVDSGEYIKYTGKKPDSKKLVLERPF